MTIQKQPTMIACNNCGSADYYFGTIKSVIEQAKSQGWIVKTINGTQKHFCGQDCLQEYKENGSSRWDEI